MSLSVWSDASLVTVERCDVKHVAVCANSDRFHLTISGQRSRMRGAARAKDLKRQYIIIIGCYIHDKYGESEKFRLRQTNLPTASTVVLPADDSERSFAGNARVAGFIRHPIWRICREARAPLTPLGPVISHHSVLLQGK